jgi:ABC-2 type transport system permease protein
VNKSLVLIKREFTVRVRSKGFIIGTVLAPILMATVVLLPALFMNAGSEAEQKIAVLDMTKKLTAALQQDASENRKNDEGKSLYTLIPVEMEGAPLDTFKMRLNSQIRKGEIDLFLVLPDSIFLSNRFEMYSKNTGNFQLNESVNGMVSSVVSKIRLSESGLDPEQVKKLNARVRAKTFVVGGSGAKEESGELAFMLNYILVFFIYMALIYYGMFIIRGVIEDKNSRVMEVLLSSSRPYEIMAGKIFGNGLAGLVQIGVWGLCILLASTYGAAMVKTFSPAAKIPLPSVSAELIGAFVIFFLLGYFIYSSIYAAMGSIGNSDSEIQNLQWPAIAPIMISFFLIFAINKNPDGTMAVVLSMIPFFSPLLMFTRISAHAAPPVQVLACIGICLLTIAALVWVAGRIFRVGILMHGKRPTIPEILKWIRYE